MAVKINIPTIEGMTLKTKGKYVADDIYVVLDDALKNQFGSPIELSTPEEMEAVLVSENIGKIYKYVGETNETFTNGNLYQVTEVED